jgi:hypothetical protein
MPAIQRLAVEQELPALGFFLSGQRVGGLATRRNGQPEKGDHYQ